MGLAVVRDMREARVPAGPEAAEAFETDVLAGFVLARAAAGLSDKTISADVSNLEQVRAWLGRPLWETRPADAEVYFGRVMRASAQNTRVKRAQAVKVCGGRHPDPYRPAREGQALLLRLSTRSTA